MLIGTVYFTPGWEESVRGVTTRMGARLLLATATGTIVSGQKTLRRSSRLWDAGFPGSTCCRSRMSVAEAARSLRAKGGGQ